MGYECKHLWSLPDTAGNIYCLWCNAVERPPIQYSTDETTVGPSRFERAYEHARQRREHRSKTP